MTRIVRFHEIGGPEVLRLEDVPVTPPGSDEVAIDVRAIGLNRAEAMFRSGQYLEDPKLPARIGYEAAGTVAAIGPGVSVSVGQRVASIPGFSMNKYGAYGEQVVVPAWCVVPTPDSVSDQEAAAAWMQYLTAWGALVEIAKLSRGDSILISAASSSVGHAAIQIANMVGAVPIALTRRSAKAKAIEAAGAAHVVATEEQDLVAEVKRITGAKPPRVAFDPVGGPTVEKLCAALAPGGILFQYGALSTEPTPLPLFAVLGKGLTIRGYTLFEFTQTPGDALQRGIDFVLRGLAAGQLKPVIAKTFPLDHIVEAHRYMEGNEQIGKIVVTV
jgi:NADPH:quinone reductase and related Zn-dependent oxidoreductases